MPSLEDFRHALDTMPWNNKALSKMLGQLPLADRKEAGRMFNEAKQVVEREAGQTAPEPAVPKRFKRFLWSSQPMNGPPITMYDGEVHIGQIVVTGENLKVKR